MTRPLERFLRMWPMCLGIRLRASHLLRDFEGMRLDRDDMQLLMANRHLFPSPSAMTSAVNDWSCELKRGCSSDQLEIAT